MLRLQRLLKEDISFFSMLTEVESLELLLLADSQAHRGVENLKNNQRPDDGDGDSRPDAGRLIDDLPGISFEKPNGEFFIGNDGRSRKYARKERAQRSADAVNAEGIQRVVVT